MGLFYTGKGDKGSSIVGKKRYPKDSIILKALGDLDELNSFIGLARSSIKKKTIGAKLKAVQENLFIIQARIAWIMYPKFKTPEIRKEKIKELEKEIEAIEKKIRPERGFIIPGSGETDSWLDVLRTITRRVERTVNTLHRKHPLPPEILTYLNRLSSYFYALAREQAKKKEPRPSYK